MRQLLNPAFIKRFQRYTVLSAFILTAVLIVYSLIFSTDTYPLFYYTDPYWNYVKGSEIYLEVQAFNRTLLIMSIISLCVALSFFVYFSHKRRIYYITNYISISVWSGYNLVMAIVMIAKLSVAISHFYLIDFEKYKEYAEDMSQRYVDTPYMFITGIVIAIIMILFSLALTLLMYLKFVSRKNELAERANKEAAGD